MKIIDKENLRKTVCKIFDIVSDLDITEKKFVIEQVLRTFNVVLEDIKDESLVKAKSEYKKNDN